MGTLSEVVSKLVLANNLFGLPLNGQTQDGDEVHGHMLSPIILLATRDDVLARTFPADGSVHPEHLYAHWVDSSIVTEEHVRKLHKYRAAFTALQIAWLDLTNYTDPPCLDNDRMRRLIDFTKSLPGAE